ncbi:MAG TPA: BON domain-containing protein [Usitatibacter sp.]|nr:BON domain-containing protein [Usitatibacter sp.]
MRNPSRQSLEIAIGVAIAAGIVAFAFAPAVQADNVVVIEAPPQAAGMAGTLDPGSDVSYAADASDRAVAARVMQALAEDPALEGSQITVLVDQGDVRLSGTTRDEEQGAYALEVARDAAGPTVAVSGETLEPAPADVVR